MVLPKETCVGEIAVMDISGYACREKLKMLVT